MRVGPHRVLNQVPVNNILKSIGFLRRDKL